MKRIGWILLAAVLLRLFGLAPAGTDAAELLPAQVVCIGCAGRTVTVQTDNGVRAAGADLERALERAEHTAEGTLFFGTVEHVILCEGAERLSAELPDQTKLRPAAKVYLAPECVDPARAAAYLRAHPGLVTISAMEAARLAGQPLRLPQVRRTAEGGLLLEP